MRWHIRAHLSSAQLMFSKCHTCIVSSRRVRRIYFFECVCVFRHLEWCFADAAVSLLKRALLKNNKKKPLDSARPRTREQRLLIFVRALILWWSERRSGGGGDNVELLIHEITELCNVRNTLKPAMKFGVFNPLELCRSSILWRLGVMRGALPSLQLLDEEQGYTLERSPRRPQRPHTHTQILECFQTMLTALASAQDGGQTRTPPKEFPGRSPVPKRAQLPQTLARQPL